MCGKYASQSETAQSATVAAQEPAYVVDPSHPLYDAQSATDLLGTLPAPLAEHLRDRARSLSDVLLVRMFGVVTDPVRKVILPLVRPDIGGAVPFITAAISEEITRRYKAGTLALPFVQGGEATINYLESPEAKAEIAAFRAAQDRGGATLN